MIPDRFYTDPFASWQVREICETERLRHGNTLYYHITGHGWNVAMRLRLS